MQKTKRSIVSFGMNNALGKEELDLRRRLLFRLLRQFDFDAPQFPHECIADPVMAGWTTEYENDFLFQLAPPVRQKLTA
jgi:hypothetical protein